MHRGATGNLRSLRPCPTRTAPGARCPCAGGYRDAPPYASVATGELRAANRDPRRNARNVTCKQTNRSSSAGAASSPAPSKAAGGGGGARGRARVRPGARGRRTDARNAHADHVGVAHDIVVARRIIASYELRGREAHEGSRNETRRNRRVPEIGRGLFSIVGLSVRSRKDSLAHSSAFARYCIVTIETKNGVPRRRSSSPSPNPTSPRSLSSIASNSARTLSSTVSFASHTHSRRSGSFLFPFLPDGARTAEPGRGATPVGLCVRVGRFVSCRWASEEEESRCPRKNPSTSRRALETRSTRPSSFASAASTAATVRRR